MMRNFFFNGLRQRIRRQSLSLIERKRFLSAAPKGSKSLSDLVKQRGPVTWRSLAVTLVLVAGSVTYFVTQKEQRQEEALQKRSKKIGRPALGGQWTLVDHNGRPYTDATLAAEGHKFALLYFGFTFCPDICPAELIKMKRIVERLDEMEEIGPIVVPVFISVDPHRDGIAQVRHYIKDFHERTIGLTGTVQQVSEACRRFRVYHSVADQDLENEDDYLVDHSIVMYLIGPDGRFLDFYTQLTEVDESVQRIKDIILETLAEEEIELS